MRHYMNTRQRLAEVDDIFSPEAIFNSDDDSDTSEDNNNNSIDECDDL